MGFGLGGRFFEEADLDVYGLLHVHVHKFTSCLRFFSGNRKDVKEGGDVGGSLFNTWLPEFILMSM